MNKTSQGKNKNKRRVRKKEVTITLGRSVNDWSREGKATRRQMGVIASRDGKKVRYKVPVLIAVSYNNCNKVSDKLNHHDHGRGK